MAKDKHEMLGITPREKDFSEWYHDIIKEADLAEHSPTRGSMTIKPGGYAIWEMIQSALDRKFKETGVKNAYFPLLIPESFLKKEAEHVEGFSPQVAVVTHAGGKKLEEKYVIRPTSETIIYEAFSRWIESYRDLPLLLNQWANVMRWEMRPRLFLRTTEFLWQEGHTAHASNDEADKRARLMLAVYKDFLKDHLAIPVIAGEKTERERFAGAKRTYTVEAMMQDGKALQAGTSHNLSDNFAKAFEVTYLNRNGKRQYVHNTSWGVSTRLIGGLIMAHSDDRGLVLPPKMASIKAVIMSIDTGSESEELKKYCLSLKDALSRAGIESIVDSSEKTIGEKHFYHEKRGVPLRFEIGKREIKNNGVVMARRDTGEKRTLSLSDAPEEVLEELEKMQSDLYKKALERQKKNSVKVENWEDFKTAIEEGKFVYAHWSGGAGVEEKIAKETKATIRCIPFERNEEEGKCVYSGKSSVGRVLFARAY